MLKRDIPTVEVSIDERYSQGEDLGIDLISNVSNPAVKIKGVAFESHLIFADSYNDYPKAASENAKIALRWAEENGWGSCGTPVGKARANQLAKGESISRDTIARMAAFERHRQNSNKELGDGCGRLMWLAWGGDEGIAWAQRKLKQIDKEKMTFRNVCFTDNKKYRIAAPVLVPDDIYRNDEDGEYFIRFTPQKIEELAKKFMSQLPNKNGSVFNLEHGDEMIDSFILEAILADTDSKINMIEESFGVIVPKGTFFVVQQFNDKDKFEELVSKGQIGFSIEGFLGMELIDNKNQLKQSKMNKNSKLTKMKKKQKFVGVKRTFKSASKRKLEEIIQDEELIVIADELVEGAEVVIVEDVTEGAIEDFTGEVEVTVEGVNETLIIEEGVITEIVVEETEMESEEEKEEYSEEKEEEMESKEEELETEEKEEMQEGVNPEAEEVSNDVMTEVMNVINPKFEEIYTMIAEIKAELDSMKTPSTEEEVAMKKNFSTALITFNKKFSDEK
jgi:hypothetical protein